MEDMYTQGNAKEYLSGGLNCCAMCSIKNSCILLEYIISASVKHARIILVRFLKGID